MEKKYRITVEGQRAFDIISEQGRITINGETVIPDIVRTGERVYHLLLDNRSYKAILLHADRQSRSVTLLIEGREYHLTIQDKYDLLLEKLGMAGGSQHKADRLKAPMPGLVLDVLVKPGDRVARGEKVLILEAMKMENILKAPGDGVVDKVLVKKGDAVEKNQVLIEMK